MKKLMSAAGIAAIVLGVLALLFSVFSWFGYYHGMDGSPEMYASLHRNMVLFLVIGLVLAAIGIACLIVRRKM